MMTEKQEYAAGAVDRQVMFSSLPAPCSCDLRPLIAAHVQEERKTLVVLDDDPTGTQTVYDVPVLTEWSVPSLRKEFDCGSRCFYILTNSRSLPAVDADKLNREIARNLIEAAGGRDRFTLVSRSDSTLRGHFPVETDALSDEVGPFDLTLLIPYFEAGGRYTINNTHYVADGDQLMPAASTPFARDASFGYSHSSLPEWVEEKTSGSVQAEDVFSLSLSLLRKEGTEAVARFLADCPSGAVCVVNAAAPSDLDVLSASLIRPECKGKRFLFRTGAQFVSARLGLEPRPLLGQRELTMPLATGGLIVVGSYVPMTTSQLERLRGADGLEEIELPIEPLLDRRTKDDLIEQVGRKINDTLESGRNVVVFTARELIRDQSGDGSLSIGRQVSDALVALVQGLKTCPSFLIAKGGITSSDVATRGLGVRRAVVAGQVLPGIPVWRLGEESRFPNLPYIVFPGNVGGPNALADVYETLSSKS